MPDTVDLHSSADRTRLALAEAVRIAGVGVVVCDANAQIVQVDGLANRWLGESGARELLNGVLQTALTGAHVVKTLEPKNSALSLKFVGSPVRGEDGELIGGVAVIQDNTREKYVELSQRELVANVGHELKTPIAAMALLAETLVNENDTSSSQNLADRLAREAVRAGHVVDDLLGLGAQKSRVSTVSSCRMLCESAVARLSPAAEARTVSLSVNGHDAEIIGEPIEITSALHHLIDNAIKYSEENSEVRIEIRADDTTCEISVIDSGRGIARAHIHRIFERFYRVDAGTSRAGGTGLGLAIVKHAVERNGGSVRVESIEGKGSTFTIRMKRGVIQ